MTITGRAFVLGGGVAGMVGAFGLSDRGFAVELLESRKQCGGRAFSSEAPKTQRRLDNGHHVMLGCYRSMRRLLRRLGTEDDFQQDRSLTMAYRFGPERTASLRLSRLPVPLAMPWSLLRLGIGFGARLRSFRGMASVMWGANKTWTFAEWLRRRGQLGEPDQVMWRPLCRAVMNVEPEEASAVDFLASLREAFLGSAASAAFWLPKKPWGQLLGDAAPRAFDNAGIKLRTGARVTELKIKGARVVAIVLGDEVIEVEQDDVVVSAMPWFALRKVLGDHESLSDSFGTLRSSPIVTAYFTTTQKAPPDEGPVVALVGGQPFHFLLRTPGDPAAQFAMLSGGDRSFDGLSVTGITSIAKQQLQRYYGSDCCDDNAEIVIRKEQHATFVADPGSAMLRPAPGRLSNGPTNLMVCGDWTATGLPATLEGAARSAEKLLAALSTQH